MTRQRRLKPSNCANVAAKKFLFPFNNNFTEEEENFLCASPAGTVRPAQSGRHRFTVSPANGLKMRFMLSLSCYSPWRRTYVCLQVSPLSVEIKPSPTHDEMLMLLAGNQQSTRVAGHGKEIGVCIKPGPKARSFTIQLSISQ